MEDFPPEYMKAGPIRLVFEEKVNVKPEKGLVPFYHFKIIDETNNQVGYINFKVGDTEHVTQYAGHIGYQVLPSYRGNSYSYYACEAIKPFVSRFYKKAILTCNPENVASISIIKKLNAKFINEVTVPKHDPSYKSGSDRKLRYEWQP